MRWPASRGGTPTTPRTHEAEQHPGRALPDSGNGPRLRGPRANPGSCPRPHAPAHAEHLSFGHGGLRREEPGCEEPAHRAVAPAAGRAQRADRPDRRRGLRRIQHIRRTLSDSDARQVGRGRPALHALPHDGHLLSDAPGAVDRTQPPLGRHGRHHRDRDRCAGLLLGAAQLDGAAGGDAQAQRLLHGPVRQEPRGPGLADEPGRPLRRLAHGRRRLRVLLRLPRRRGEPVVSDALRGHHAGREQEDARAGLPPDGGHDRQGGQVDRAGEGAHARQALLHLLRPGRDARAAPRPEGMGRQVQGQVRPGLGQAAGGDLRTAEAARGDPGGLPAHRAPEGDPVLGLDARGDQARAAPRDGGLRGLPRVHRLRGRPHRGSAAEARHPRRHADLLHRRRQRRLGRGRPQRQLQRDELLQRPAVARDGRVPHCSASTSWADPSPTTTTPWAGRTR